MQDPSRGQEPGSQPCGTIRAGAGRSDSPDEAYPVLFGWLEDEGVASAGAPWELELAYLMGKRRDRRVR
ncbi:MAG: hypothetical protein H0T69_04200 [Thermoleophilaceae bacterium]|nr:hypothetical protein [Thermoleophilaceae bacterium]